MLGKVKAETQGEGFKTLHAFLDEMATVARKKDPPVLRAGHVFTAMYYDREVEEWGLYDEDLWAEHCNGVKNGVLKVSLKEGTNGKLRCFCALAVAVVSPH